MPLTFHADGDQRDASAQVAAWREAAAASPTAADFAGTYLRHADAELACRVERGRLIIETAPAAKATLDPERGLLHAYLRLECDLPLDVLADLSAVLAERVRVARRLAGASA